MENVLPAPRLSSRLEVVRRTSFVGRAGALAAFDAALAGTEGKVLLVHGRSGTGKTTLLAEYARRARDRERTVIEVSGAAGPRFAEALGSGPLAAGGHGRSDRGGGIPGPVVIVDDAGDAEDHLRTRILPGLPSSAVVVLATNAPPSSAWELDLGWRSLAVTIPLGPFTAREAAELLGQHGLCGDAGAELWELSEGHPLTIALLAPHWSADGLIALSRNPEVACSLLRHLTGGCLTPAQIEALFVCAHGAAASQETLRDVLGGEGNEELWSWLCSLGVTSRDGTGVRLGSVCSHLVEAYMLDRSPERYVALHDAVHSSARERLESNRLAGAACLGPVRSLFSGHRSSALSRLWGSPVLAGLWPRRGTAEDHALVTDLVRLSAGDAEAAHVSGWLTAQPGSLFVTAQAGQLVAAAICVTVTADEGRASKDPVVRAAVRAADAAGLIRPNDTLQVLRAVTDRTGQRDTMVAVYTGVIAAVLEWLMKFPSLALAVGPFDRRWQRILGDLGMRPVDGTDISGSRMFSLDFRRVPANAWFRHLMRHDMSADATPLQLTRPAALGYAQFSDAVQRALRDFHRPDRLVANPLAECALLAESGPPVADALRDRIVSAVRSVGVTGRDELLTRVLEMSYVQPRDPRDDDEEAATALDLPVGDFRRYLDQGVRRVVDLLWMSEITRVPSARHVS